MRLALFGLPGAGKGTQAEMLSKHFRIPHISTGDLFREILNTDTDLAKEVKNVVTSGQLVSDELVTKIAFDRLSKQDCNNGFILDGYPRTISQVHSLSSSEYMISCLILIEVTQEEVIRRLSGRRLCENCTTIFHISSLSPKNNKYYCLKCDQELIQRKDDLAEVILTMLKIFNDNMKQVFDFFKEKNLLIKINGNDTPKNVFDSILYKLKKL